MVPGMGVYGAGNDRHRSRGKRTNDAKKFGTRFRGSAERSTRQQDHSYLQSVAPHVRSPHDRQQ
jgi:hypothetical protein